MSKKTLNQTNLETLGSARLAALLMEVSTGSAEIKRRLRLELSHNLGAGELAHEVRKRLASLRKSSSYVSWRKRRALIKDLSTQRAMIVDKIAPEDPTAAFDLLWQFVDLAPSILARVDDSKGEVGDVFREALGHFEHFAPHADVDAEALATRVWEAVQDNGHGEWDGLIALIAPALGSSGLTALEGLVQAFADTPLDDGAPEHEAIVFLRQLRGGSNYAAKQKAAFVKARLQEIATAAGNSSAYIATYSDDDLRTKPIAAEVAHLMLSEGQAEQAFEVLKAAADDGGRKGRGAWDDAYIACLTQLGREDEAQAHRKACFMSDLDVTHLRDHLKRLPDFDDVEAEIAAKEHVLGYPNTSMALRFCLDWPDLLTAAQVVEVRADDLDADNIALLTAVAEALRARHPLAAIRVWRAMITAALEQNRSSRYALAAEQLADCAAVDGDLEDYGDLPTHAEFMQRLQGRHGGKASFWAKLY